MQQKILAKLKALWAGFLAFSPGQKVVTGAVLLVLVVGGFAFSSWASKPSYAPLFTNLAPADASGIIDKLNANKTPYQLAANGTEILVPSKQVYNLRLTMSAAGLPTSSSTSGYSLLDQEGITTSDFKQHVDYQRAIEGELDKTIESISGVTAAAVHLAIPQQTVFDDGTQKPTASVLLTTQPGLTLTSQQVQSVVNLVSSSVPGLTADQVSVSDSTGKVLSSAGSDASMAADTRTAAMTQYDNQTGATLQAMLDKLVGTGNSVVTVNADLDFDKKVTSSVSYAKASGVPPLSQSGSTESYGPGGSSAGAVLGANSVSPSASAGASGSGNYQNSSNVQDNAINEVSQSASAAPGSIRKLSVAVLLDSNAGPVNVAAVQKLVSSAVGLDPTRGDTLAVQSQAFNTSQAAAAAKASAAAAAAAASAKNKAALIGMLKTAGVVVLVLIVIIWTVLANRRRKRDEESPDDLDVFLSTLNDSPGSLPPAPVDIVPPQNREAAINQARQRDLAEMADAQPQEVARLLRTWLNTKES